jgi:hypothetical protein
MAAAGLGETVSELRQAYESGRTRSLAWRQAQLRGLLRLLKDQEEAAFHALHEDLGKHRAEAYRDEVCLAFVTFSGLISARTHVLHQLRCVCSIPSPQVGLVVKSANEALRQLGKWMTPEKVTISIGTLGVADSSSVNLTVMCYRFGDACCAGVGSSGGVPGERADRAGAARSHPHLLLLERSVGYLPLSSWIFISEIRVPPHFPFPRNE